MGRTAHLPTGPVPPFLTVSAGARTMAAVQLLRRLLPLLLAAAAIAAPAGAQPEPFASRLERALAVPHVSPARSGAAVVDLGTGEVVFTHNAALPLAPASNEKLLVTYGVLTELGPSYRFETDVLGQGSQQGSTWIGDLVLKGYGDPTLSSADLAALAAQVRAAGIVHVSGDVVGDESWFDSRRTSPGWKPAYYIEESPPLSALVVDRSRFGRSVSRSPALAA